MFLPRRIWTPNRVQFSFLFFFHFRLQRFCRWRCLQGCNSYNWHWTERSCRFIRIPFIRTSYQKHFIFHKRNQLRYAGDFSLFSSSINYDFFSPLKCFSWKIDFQCRIYINMVEGTSGYTTRDLWVACHKNSLPSTKRAEILISTDALKLLMMQQNSLTTSYAYYAKNLDLNWRTAPSCTWICSPSSMTSLRMLLHMVWSRSQIV